METSGAAAGTAAPPERNGQRRTGGSRRRTEDRPREPCQCARRVAPEEEQQEDGNGTAPAADLGRAERTEPETHDGMRENRLQRRCARPTCLGWVKKRGFRMSSKE